MDTTELLGPGRKKARIEIIPLIDVIFFLLATFVLFTLSLDRIGSIGVNLPKVPPIPPPPSETLVSIQASEQGTLYWKQGTGTAELISMAELPAKLAEYQHRVADPRVLVRGDMHAKLGPAVLVLDEVRRSGIQQVSIETMVSKTGN